MAFAVLLIIEDESEVHKYTEDKNLVGIYKNPTQFCLHLKPRETTYVKGAKYEWMMCTECKKPVRTPFSTVGRYLYPFGSNLMDKYLIKE